MKNTKDTLYHAYSRVPIYIEKIRKEKISIDELMDREWEDIPTITKNEFLENDCEAGIAIEYLNNYINFKLLCSTTSGSTGKCLNTYWTKEMMDLSLMELWVLRKKMYNINPQDRLCYFYSIKSIQEDKIGELLVQQRDYDLGFNKSKINCKDNIKRVYEMMLEYSPKWMMIQPSIAILIANFALENNLSQIGSLEYIELTGEMLLDDDRRIIEKYFNCNIANQYGMNEINSIALECTCGRMHCLNSNIYAEILDSDNKVLADGIEGEIHVTSLQNKVMPFVRYKTGDRAKIFHNLKCECGLSSPVLMLTKGRSVDWVLHEDGRRTSSYVFCDAIENTNRMTSGAIKQFQVRQISYEKIVIKLSISDDINEDLVCDRIIDNLCEDIVDDIDIYFEICRELFPDEKTGKLRFFICEI